MDKEVKELKFSVPWGHVAAKSWGSPEKKHILAVHGTLDNAGSFNNLFKLLPNKYYIVGIDLPGHGLSSHFSPGMNLDFFDYIHAIKYILDKLKWKSCLYIGHSFGGQLGTIFSIIHPGILEKIISLDAFLPRSLSDNELLERLREVARVTIFHSMNKENRAYSKEHVLNALKTRRHFPLNDVAAESLFERAVTKVGDDLYEYNRDMRMKLFLVPTLNRNQYLELIKHAKTPTLIIKATDSWFDFSKHQRDDLKFYKNIMPNNYMFKIVDGNHDLHNNNPERIVSIVLDFLENSNLNSNMNNIRSKL